MAEGFGNVAENVGLLYMAVFKDRPPTSVGSLEKFRVQGLKLLLSEFLSSWVEEG